MVVDHEEFKHMETGTSRISEDRHYSETARGTSGQTCAGGHGTHVASLAAGFESGAAKDATIVSGARASATQPSNESMPSAYGAVGWRSPLTTQV